MSSQVSTTVRRELNPRQAETVERLLSAAMDELRELGHEALTVRTVARRAGVSPATAYTYLASKDHLFAELFWRHLTTDTDAAPTGDSGTTRVQAVARRLVERIAAEPALAAAVTPALLGSDASVERLRLRIGAEFVRRFRTALPPDADPRLLDTLVLALCGALLQAGMGVLTYAEMADRFDAAVAVIMDGHS